LLWHTLLRAAAEHLEELASALSALLDLLPDDAAYGRRDILRPQRDELDVAVSGLLVASLQGSKSADDLMLLKRLLETPGM
jgi:hypothetical protein